ncbi:MAG TPA: hypothetical protein VKB18_09495 [Gemmatimonadota bacterium]|nr:hypothetical protein [Gemmatimonadota bacterium]
MLSRPRWPLFLAALVLPTVGRPHPASAQQPADSIRAAAGRLEPWTPVRLWLRSGERATGRLVAVGADGLRLEGRAEPVPVTAVDSLRVRGRAAGTGLVVGLIVGGGGGAALGALAGLVAAGVCEYECPSAAGGFFGGAALGLLAGGAGGALTGLLVGSGLPRWVRPGSADGPAIGELTVSGAWSAYSSAADGSGAGGEAAYLALFGPFAAGPEFGWNGLGGGRSAWHVGGVARLDPLEGDLRPYLTGGMGLYAWRSTSSLDPSIELLGGSVGAGVAWRPRPVGWGLRAEGRWHTNLGRSGGLRPLGFFTAGAGVSLRW